MLHRQPHAITSVDSTFYRQMTTVHLSRLLRKQAPGGRLKVFLPFQIEKNRGDLYKALFFAFQDTDHGIFINVQNPCCISNTTAINSHFNDFLLDPGNTSIIAIVQHKCFSWTKHYFCNDIAVYFEHSCLIS